jgi:DNA-binding transcriptional LysR family regulator
MTQMRVTRKPQTGRSTRLPDGIRHGNVELRHLRYFVVVAEELNLRRAADRLEITQPAVTKQVSGLEEQVGASLFARERNRLTGLTSAGVELLAEARHILEQVEDAIRHVQLVALGRSGRLRIGLTDDAATLRLTSILAAFHARSPNVLVELVELSGREVLSALRANIVDLALASEPQNADGLAVEELWQESWSVVLPEGHPLCCKEAIVPADLAGEALALVGSSAPKDNPRPAAPAWEEVGLASRCIPCFEPSNGHHVGARRFRHRNSALFVGIGRGPPGGDAAVAPRSWLRCDRSEA